MVNAPKSLTCSLGVLGAVLTLGCMYYSALEGISSQNFRGEIVGSAVFSPDGATLYGVGTRTTPKISENCLTAWDAQTGKRLWRHTPPDGLGKLSISHSGKLLLTTSGHHLSLYDTQTGRLVRKLATPFLRYSTSPAQFLPGDKQLLTIGQDAKLVVLDVTSGKQVRQLKHKPSDGAFALSPDGRRSVSLEWKGGRNAPFPLGTITGPGEKKIDLEGQTGW